RRDDQYPPHLLQKTLTKARRKRMIWMLWLQNSLQFRSPQLGRSLTQEKLPPAPPSKNLLPHQNSLFMTFQYQIMCIS
ncbi:hypothetical protein Tco_0605072, partial [Tanacetum coccineum]